MPRWQDQPFQLKVKKGDRVVFCACNQSKNGPYCDGSHSRLNTGKTPLVIEFEKDETSYICGCQCSKHRPFCDGSHKTLKT